MKRSEGLQLASSFKQQLLKSGYPIKHVYLFGSVAKGTSDSHSDIDIAIVCYPFKISKHEENVEFLWASKDIDLRIETVTLHPEDFQNKYFTLAKEIERYGVEA